VKGEGIGTSKKEAEQHASQQVIEYLEKEFNDGIEI
jgi:dsRNA-specific ribonuclease